jgi:hypothetical protein
MTNKIFLDVSVLGEIAFIDDNNALNAEVFESEFISAKYNFDREPAVQRGLIELEHLFPETDFKLLFLLDKVFENKNLRSVVKNELDKVADAAGYEHTYGGFGREGYLQSPHGASLVRGYQQGTPPALDFAFHNGFIQQETIVVA